MNRRRFALGIASSTTAMALPAPGWARAQSQRGTAEDSWQSNQKEILVEWDASLFQAPSHPHGGTAETLILRSFSSRKLLTAWITLLEGTLTTPGEMRDYIHNDTDLMYGLDGTVNERALVVENEDAFGVLYRPIFQGKADTWSYEEFVSLRDYSGKAVHVWLNGNRSEFDRSAIAASISSISINDELMLRAIREDEFLDHIEAMPVITP